MDVDQNELIKDCKILVPAILMGYMMWEWFREEVMETLLFLGKFSIGAAVFLLVWEGVKRARKPEGELS